jgi:predicted ATP-dependent endonuclease of OLD family
MRIKVLLDRKRVNRNDVDSDFYLTYIKWDDYGFKTSYDLYLSGRLTSDKEPLYIGNLKILMKGQVESHNPSLKEGYLSLPLNNICSLSTNLDYYERISHLPENLQAVLKELKDIAIHTQFRYGFEDEPGFTSSLLRGTSLDDEVFVFAPIFLSQEFNQIPDIETVFEFRTPEMLNQIIFDFSSPSYGFSSRESLPNRISVIVGKNGSGKSQLLSRLSRVIYSGIDVRNRYLTKLGELKPQGIGFPRIINVSYSAFDSFQLPGVRIQDIRRIINDTRNKQGRFQFCGIRDIASELEYKLSQISGDDKTILLELLKEDKHKYNKLKSLDELSLEFENAIYAIRLSEAKQRLFDKTIKIISYEPSLKEFRNLDFNDIQPEEIQFFFQRLSTGHKFVFHAITNIIQFTEQRSLILFDEPEVHLHPSLLAVLMRALRIILEKTNSLMIVATHSPVVVQETLSKHVHIIKRDGKAIKVTNPEIQTFGENVGLLTSHIFGLAADFTDYHTELDLLIDYYSEYISDPNKLLDQIVRLFEGQLSSQARAYIISKIY